MFQNNPTLDAAGAATRATAPAGDSPYCKNCNYSLEGLTESSKCPECGKPLVEVLMRRTFGMMGRRYKSATHIFGQPLLCIAYGPSGKERFGHARGIIALGDMATGWLAIGGRAVGIIAIGGFALGVVAIGGWAAGLIAFGGLAVGGLTLGGGSVGLIAVGGGAVGVIANGGGAVGYYAQGGGVWGAHTIGPLSRDPAAVDMFKQLSWLFGSRPNSIFATLVPAAWAFFGALLVALLCALVLLIGHRLRPPAPTR